MDNPLSRQEPEPTSRVTPEALYSETVSGYTFSPRIRTGIAAGPNLQLTGLGFTRNLLLKKVSPEPAHKPGDTVRTAVHREWCVLHSRAVHIARHSQLYICSDAGWHRRGTEPAINRPGFYPKLIIKKGQPRTGAQAG